MIGDAEDDHDDDSDLENDPGVANASAAEGGVIATASTERKPRARLCGKTATNASIGYWSLQSKWVNQFSPDGVSRIQ